MSCRAYDQRMKVVFHPPETYLSGRWPDKGVAGREAVVNGKILERLDPSRVVRPLLEAQPSAIPKKLLKFGRKTLAELRRAGILLGAL